MTQGMRIMDNLFLGERGRFSGIRERAVRVIIGRPAGDMTGRQLRHVKMHIETSRSPEETLTAEQQQALALSRARIFRRRIVIEPKSTRGTPSSSDKIQENRARIPSIRSCYGESVMSSSLPRSYVIR